MPERDETSKTPLTYRLEGERIREELYRRQNSQPPLWRRLLRLGRNKTPNGNDQNNVSSFEGIRKRNRK